MTFQKIGLLSLCSTFVMVTFFELPAQNAAPVLPAPALPAPLLPAPAEPNFKARKAFSPTHSQSEGQLSIRIKESVFNEFAAGQRVQEGPVRDFILGADVFGTQRTISESSVDFLPSSSSALLLFKLQGTTQNQTISLTSQATIQNRGCYQFTLQKRVQFDGNVVSTWSPGAFMQVHQRNIGAETPLTPLPIFGRLAEQTAMNVANRRLPEAQQIAAFKVTRKVAPEFNQEIDLEISKVNQQLIPAAQRWLKKNRLADLKFSGHSTATEVVVTASTNLTRNALKTVQTMQPQSSGALVVDAGFLNNLIERLPLAGLRIPDTQAEAFLENQRIDLSHNDNPKLFTIVLDEEKPLVLFLRDGALEVDIRLSIQPILGESIGSYLIAFRLKAIPQANSFELEPSILQVRALDDPDTEEMTFSSKMMTQQISQQLKPISIPRNIPVSFLQSQQVTLDIVSVEEVSGELKVEFQVKLPRE